MVAQLPRGHPQLNELRAVAAELMARLADLRERALPAPQALWQAAERFQPLLDGVEPAPGEAEELWELALALPRAWQDEGLLALLLVRDRVEDVEPGGA
ncbi:hypothetical protein ABIA32_002309 [Streptacidiphilus sp. MAP12-20]|uniref:hypothetical protein n=1 Tax=Streptacidiphilus sp. MAP12-20 TaxID=3156299 RepID=UPI0035111B13